MKRIALSLIALFLLSSCAARTQVKVTPPATGTTTIFFTNGDFSAGRGQFKPRAEGSFAIFEAEESLRMVPFINLWEAFWFAGEVDEGDRVDPWHSNLSNDSSVDLNEVNHSQSLLRSQGIDVYPDPLKDLSAAILKARQLKFHVDLLLLDHNGEYDDYGNHLAGGFVGAWIDFNELIERWSILTIDQEPDTTSVELVQTKAALVKAADRLMEEWELVKSDLKNVRKAAKALPPK